MYVCISVCECIQTYRMHVEDHRTTQESVLPYCGVFMAAMLTLREWVPGNELRPSGLLSKCF